MTYEHSLSLRPFKFHDYPWGLIDNICKRPQWDIYNVIWRSKYEEWGRYGGQQELVVIEVPRGDGKAWIEGEVHG